MSHGTTAQRLLSGNWRKLDIEHRFVPYDACRQSFKVLYRNPLGHLLLVFHFESPEILTQDKSHLKIG